jgi:hypothetical protein
MLVSIASAGERPIGQAGLMAGSPSAPGSRPKALQPVSGADLARAAIGSGGSVTLEVASGVSKRQTVTER